MDKRRFSLESSHPKNPGNTANNRGSPENTSTPTVQSALLQDLLREKKAQTRRTEDVNSSRAHAQGHDLENRAVQSSPIAATAARERPNPGRRRGSAAGSKEPSIPNEMGVREMDQVSCSCAPYFHGSADGLMQYMSKLKKQNFDLKLELFHRRQRTEALEAKLEGMDKLQIDNEELQLRNKDLLRELEYRDLAVSEAVAMICSLEARIEETGQPSATTLYPDSQTCTGSNEEPGPWGPQADGALPSTLITRYPQTSDSPGEPSTTMPPKDPSHVDSLVSAAARIPWRAPSFLKENKKSTQALRGLYLSDENSTYGNPSLFSTSRPGSRFSADEHDPDSYSLNSPRLSMLSESSFLSVYGKAHDSNPTPAKKKKRSSYSQSSSSEDERHSLPIIQHEARTQKWINERRKQNSLRRRPPRDGAGGRFSSIDEVVDVIPIEWRTEQTARKMLIRSPSRRKRDEPIDFVPLPSQGRTIFGHGFLPPTPDTMSISNRGTNSSTPSIITEKSLLDGTPQGAKAYRALIPEGRPQSAESVGGVSNLIAAPVLDEDTELITWESEHEESTPVAQSNAGTIGQSPEPVQTSTFMGKSLNAKQLAGDTPPRPRLTSYATDMMFNGEDCSSIQPSRTMSFSSPASGQRRRSVQFPSVGYEAAEISRATASSFSGRSRTGERTPIATPTKEGRNNWVQTPPDGRRGAQVSLSDVEKDEPRQSSAVRLKNLFLGRKGSPGVKQDADFVESPPAEVQDIPPFKSRQRRPSSIQLPRTSKPVIDPAAGSRIARPTSSTRRYSGLSGLPDLSTVVGCQDTILSHEPAKDTPEKDSGADLSYGKSSTGGVAHQRTNSESRQISKAAGEKWSFGIGKMRTRR